MVYSDSLNEVSTYTQEPDVVPLWCQVLYSGYLVPTHQYTLSSLVNFGLNDYVSHQIINNKQINREFSRLLDQHGKYTLYSKRGLFGCEASETEIREFTNFS